MLFCKTIIYKEWELELELDVNYSIFGSYHPATRYEPAEYPEIEIEEVTFQNAFDIYSETNIELSPEDKANIISELEDYIIEECWDDARNEAEEGKLYDKNCLY